MKDYELTIEYSTTDSNETNEKSININLQDYEDSFRNDADSLQKDHTKSEVNKIVRPLKEQYIFECISSNLNENEKLNSLIDPLVDEVDEFVTGLND